MCVCLSMLYLFLAFFTHLIFPVLRTLPGKNIMCLIFALFMSQGLTQFGLTKTVDEIECTLGGVLIHYFWLATFFLMNVCSYHVLKVFALFVRDKFKRKRPAGVVYQVCDLCVLCSWLYNTNIHHYILVNV